MCVEVGLLVSRKTALELKSTELVSIRMANVPRLNWFLFVSLCFVHYKYIQIPYFNCFILLSLTISLLLLCPHPLDMSNRALGLVPLLQAISSYEYRELIEENKMAAHFVEMNVDEIIYFTRK